MSSARSLSARSAIHSAASRFAVCCANSPVSVHAVPDAKTDLRDAPRAPPSARRCSPGTSTRTLRRHGARTRASPPRSPPARRQVPPRPAPPPAVNPRRRDARPGGPMSPLGTTKSASTRRMAFGASRRTRRRSGSARWRPRPRASPSRGRPSRRPARRRPRRRSHAPRTPARPTGTRGRSRDDGRSRSGRARGAARPSGRSRPRRAGRRTPAHRATARRRPRRRRAARWRGRGRRSALNESARRWRATMNATGSSAGTPATTRRSGSIPPADAPTTTTRSGSRGLRSPTTSRAYPAAGVRATPDPARRARLLVCTVWRFVEPLLGGSRRTPHRVIEEGSWRRCSG